VSAYQGVIPVLDERLYHADPALSSTGARKLLESPAKFRYAMDHPQPHKDAFDLGTAVHTKVLGVGSGVIAYPPEHLTPSGAVSTKAATVEWLSAKRAEGFVVVTPGQAAAADGMSEAILAHSTARAVFEQDGHPEVSVFGTDPETGVEMRARFDWRGPINADVKTTAKSASKAEFEKTVVNFSYETQESHYEDTERFATGEEERPFVFIVAETEAPYLVAVHQLDVVFREMGKAKARRARELFAECTESGIWPGHPEEVQLISPPTWAVFQHAERFE
jgi:hypothetical protein